MNDGNEQAFGATVDCASQMFSDRKKVSSIDGGCSVEGVSLASGIAPSSK
jgi:hypothetical protein